MPFQIIRNDITKVRADAIVNTANPQPVYASGTDYAVYQAAGARRLLAERKKIGPIPVGEVAVTPAFRLPAKYIIHTVGPVWEGGECGELEALASCYRKSLLIAKQLGCESIAFPLISTGVYGFPKDKALSVALSVIEDFLEENDMEVTLVVFNKAAFDLSAELVEDVRQYIDDNYVAEQQAFEYGAPYDLASEEADRDWYRRELDETDSVRYRRESNNANCAPYAPQSGDMYREEAGAHRRKPHRLPKWLRSAQRKEERRDDSLPPEYPTEASERREAGPQMFPTEAAPGIEPPPQYSMAMPRPAAGDLAKTAAGAAPEAARIDFEATAPLPSLPDIMAHLGESFQERLLRLIDARGLTDAQVYKKANVDRKLFSKIRCNPEYSPRKRTAVALAIALQLNLDETVDLLSRAGIALSPSSRFDLIVEYCIEHEIYDIFQVNAILFDYDQPLLGC